MSCFRCGSPTVAAASFCQDCGAALNAAARPAVSSAATAVLSPELRTCDGCRTAIPADAVYCPGCGARLYGTAPMPDHRPPHAPLLARVVEPPRVALDRSPVLHPDAAPAVYGGFWVRFFAAIVDSVIISVLSFLIGLASAVMGSSEALGFLVSMAVSSFYFVACPVLLGGHIGKLVFGYRIVDAEGYRLTWAAATLRYLGTWVSSIVLCLGYLSIAFEDRKQGWHDKIAGSYVVKARFAAD